MGGMMKVSITKNGVYADGQERNEGISKKAPTHRAGALHHS